MWIPTGKGNNLMKKKWKATQVFGTIHDLKTLGTYVFSFVFIFVALIQCTVLLMHSETHNFRLKALYKTNPLIIVITPTYRTPTRMADMTRMANTLSHIKDLHWLVIEDSEQTVPAVTALLERSQVPFTYLAHRTAAGYPRRGWYQRSMALMFIRSNTSQILGSDYEDGVVYFGDDDNSYDVRLFTDYIRNVKSLGVWAVGLVGGIYVEAPVVTDGKVTSFAVYWNPGRTFAVDMAGFAVNLRVVLHSDVVFGTSCRRGGGAPETCLLEDMGLGRQDIEPFGYGPEKDKDILVWHTKTYAQLHYVRKHNNDTQGYFVEK